MNTNPMWWQKAQPWVVQGCLLLVLIGLVWFGVRPLRALIFEKMDTLQQMDVVREYRKNEIQRLPELEQQHGLIREQGGELALILSKDELVGFIQEVEQLAVSEGVEIEIRSRDNTLLESKMTIKDTSGKDDKKNASARNEEDGGAPSLADKRKEKGASILDRLPLKHTLRLTLTIKAPYTAMHRYLSKLETMPYAIEVIGLHIKESPEERDRRQAQANNAKQGNVFNVAADGSDVPALAAPETQPPIVLSTDLDMVVYLKP